MLWKITVIILIKQRHSRVLLVLKDLLGIGHQNKRHSMFAFMNMKLRKMYDWICELHFRCWKGKENFHWPVDVFGWIFYAVFSNEIEGNACYSFDLCLDISRYPSEGCKECPDTACVQQAIALLKLFFLGINPHRHNLLNRQLDIRICTMCAKVGKPNFKAYCTMHFGP